MLPCQRRVERLPRVGFPVMRSASRDAAPRSIYVVRPHRLALCEIPAYTLPMLDVIDLCEELCLIPSTTGEEAAVVNACERVLQELGLEVRRQPVGDVPGRDNLLATWPGCQPEMTGSAVSRQGQAAERACLSGAVRAAAPRCPSAPSP